MTIRNKIIDYCYEKQLLDSGDGVLIGLSGGADSVCLLFMRLSMKDEFDLKLHALHVNHGIRGEEAARDEAFCKALCEKMNVSFEAVQADIPALARLSGLGLEEEGRRFRYETFEKKADELGLNKIAVAHHKNDRAETMIFQMIRGSRLKGLAGIREKNGPVIRPLLCVSREEIEEYLKENGIEYVTDSTNLSTDYTRNRIRNEILPELDSLRPRATEHIAESADYLGRVADYMDREAARLYETCVKEEEGKITFSVSGLRTADPLLSETVVYNGICALAGRKKDITGEFVRMVLELCDMQSGRSVCIKYGIRAKRVYETIVLTKNASENAVDSECLNCNNKLYTEVFTADVGTAPAFIESRGGFPKNNLKKYFDYDKILSHFGDSGKDPDIVLRTTEKNDRMTVYPDGRGRKVADILKDEKIEPSVRDRMPVVAMNSEVLMIPGIRSSEACRIDEKTKNILYIHIAEEQ